MVDRNFEHMDDQTTAWTRVVFRTRRSPPMPVEFLHTTLGFLFVLIWTMIGEIAVHKP